MRFIDLANVITKVTNNFHERYEFTRSHVKRETVFLQISLFFIMALAFMLRFEGAFEFNWALLSNDPYSQLIGAVYLNNKLETVGVFGMLAGWLTYVDPVFWFPDPGTRIFGVTEHIGTSLTGVIVKQVFLLFGMNLTMEQASFLAPAFCGTLSILVIYFLGKELGNKRMGLLAAFFYAFDPGNLQRSMAGFFSNEAVGMLCMLLAFYFFLRSVRTGSLFTSILAGLSLGGLYMSWGGYTYAVQLIVLYAIVMVLLKKTSTRLLSAYTGTILTAIAIGVLSPNLGPALLVGFTDGIIPFGGLAILIAVSIYQAHKDEITRITLITERNLELAGYLLVLGTIGFLLLNFFLPIIPTFKSKFVTVVVPFYRDQSPILLSVAEYVVQTWGDTFNDIFILVFLIPIAIIYLYRKPTERNIFFLLYLMTALYFNGSMVRLVTVLAPVACLAGAKAIDEILRPYSNVIQEKLAYNKRRRAISTGITKQHVGVAFIVVFLVLAFNTMQGLSTDNQLIQPASVSLSYKTPTGVQGYGDWYQALSWLQMNTPASSVVASWWDYGYWLAMTNRTLITDGATINSTTIGNIGAMFVSQPDISLKIAAHYDVNYILVLLGMGSSNYDNDLGKVQWMVRIASASGNLAQQLGHPIIDSNYFTYTSDGSQITGYDGAFYSSLIWALMTDNVSPTVLNNIKQQSVVSSTLTTTGYASNAALYRSIFQEVFMSQYSFIRIVKINWNLAQKYLGVSP